MLETNFLMFFLPILSIVLGFSAHWRIDWNNK